MNGAQWVVHALRAQGVNTVFGYPGGAIMPVYDALYDGGVEHLLCRHEQGAAMAAIGYARATGKTGVCIATSGPGATNLINRACGRTVRFHPCCCHHRSSVRTVYRH
ncbi:acetolactate synthase II [Escherichia coli]|nr:acetolactate synthase II [Escherichia coli]